MTIYLNSQGKLVSIHAPWEGCDLVFLVGAGSIYVFQFTHPGKGATVQQGDPRNGCDVSIHAPWEGCDTMTGAKHSDWLSVSIHAPWEGCD